MSDFNLPNLMTWKKRSNNLGESIVKNKKKLSVILLVSISVIAVTGASYLKINSLNEIKKRQTMELTILRQSEIDAKKLAESDREKLKRLSARVENIISSPETDYSILGIATTAATEVPQNIQVANTSMQTEVKNVNSSLNKTTSSALGKIEVYDPVRKNINLYEDATTVSKVLGQIQTGTELEYFKKTSGWYLVKVENLSQNVWLPEANVRSKSK